MDTKWIADIYFLCFLCVLGELCGFHFAYFAVKITNAYPLLNHGTNALTRFWYSLKASPLDRIDCSSVIGMPVTFSSKYRMIAGLMIPR